MKPNQFDELAKAMALSVTRRAAVKKFGFGLTTLALAELGLTNKAQAARGGGQPLPGEGEPCTRQGLCQPGLWCYNPQPPPSHKLSHKYTGTYALIAKCRLGWD